jgi:hypothetical protein
MKAAYDKSVCDAAEERAAAAADMAAAQVQAKANYDVVAGQLEKVGQCSLFAGCCCFSLFSVSTAAAAASSFSDAWLLRLYFVYSSRERTCTSSMRPHRTFTLALERMQEMKCGAALMSGRKRRGHVAVTLICRCHHHHRRYVAVTLAAPHTFLALPLMHCQALLGGAQDQAHEDAIRKATAMKAAYDKSVCDAAEERAAAAADMAAVRTQAKANYDSMAARLDKVSW